MPFDSAEYNMFIVINTMQVFAIIKLLTIILTYYGNNIKLIVIKDQYMYIIEIIACSIYFFFYKVSSVIEGTKSKRKVVTLSDGQASIDIKLWGGLAKTVIHEGTSIEVSCAHVDLYQNIRSLNSTGGTNIRVKSEL